MGSSQDDFPAVLAFILKASSCYDIGAPMAATGQNCMAFEACHKMMSVLWFLFGLEASCEVLFIKSLSFCESKHVHRIPMKSCTLMSRRGKICLRMALVIKMAKARSVRVFRNS